MALSWRAAVVALLGLPLVVIWPTGDTVRWWALGVVLLLVLDLVLAPSPKKLAFVRSAPTQVRLGEATATSLLVTNTGRRRIRGLLRDAWPPSAGARERHGIDVPAGERIRVTVALRPTRRGDRRSDRDDQGLGSVEVGCTAAVGGRGGLRTGAAPVPRASSSAEPARCAASAGRSGGGTDARPGHGVRQPARLRGRRRRALDRLAGHGSAPAPRRAHLATRAAQADRDHAFDTSRTSAGRIGDAPRLDAWTPPCCSSRSPGAGTASLANNRAQARVTVTLDCSTRPSARSPVGRGWSGGLDRAGDRDHPAGYAAGLIVSSRRSSHRRSRGLLPCCPHDRSPSGGMASVADPTVSASHPEDPRGRVRGGRRGTYGRPSWSDHGCAAPSAWTSSTSRRTGPVRTPTTTSCW